jgi:very-short-patch-repair endonuclease
MKDTLTRFARKLRKNATYVENILWKRLRSRQVEGIKFRRQQPIGHFIVDFVSLETKIVIELDGGQHADNAIADIERDAFLSQQGFTVLRFWNNDVLDNLDGVLEAIRIACLK